MAPDVALSGCSLLPNHHAVPIKFCLFIASLFVATAAGSTTGTQQPARFFKGKLNLKGKRQH